MKLLWVLICLVCSVATAQQCDCKGGCPATLPVFTINKQVANVELPHPDVMIAEFTASWCGPCQQMKPIVRELQRDGVPIVVIDTDANQELTREYKVSSVPCIVLVIDGKERKRLIGLTRKSDLKQMYEDGLKERYEASIDK